MTSTKRIKKPFSYHFGNILMLLAVLVLLLIYLPIINLYFFPPTLDINRILHTKGLFIVIPKIHAEAQIITNVDPWSKYIYMSALQKGVAQAKGTVLPGEKGTSFLFAHSSDEPWHITRYNVAFFRLGELKNGDILTIYKNGLLLKYQITNKKTVWPNEVSYITPSKKTQLILQTCTPIGTSLMRLLVFAKPI